MSGAPKAPTMLSALSSRKADGAKQRATDAVLLGTDLPTPLRQIVETVTPLRVTPGESSSGKRTPPPPATTSTAVTSADVAIMSKALDAVKKPRLTQLPGGATRSREVQVPAPGPISRHKSSAALTKTLIDHAHKTSSAAGMSDLAMATKGMNAKQRRAFVLKRRADEARVQQLRGIFAAYDDNKDGFLNKEYVQPLMWHRSVCHYECRPLCTPPSA